MIPDWWSRRRSRLQGCRCGYVVLALLLAIWAHGTPVHASVALLMEEPFGTFLEP
jgi:hypothetical protein